ncbi:MAG TPA: response regulator [Desulfobacterales bacterium]|nr:response regulator [Desulfobacterales bacterium]
MQIDDTRSAGGGTILLVDDEDMVLEVGARVLEKLHYAVLTAGNGQDAVALFARHADRIALVILDMNMPGMSGGVVFEELRKLKPDVKVLLTSGYGLDGQIQELLASGACGFAQKPFSIAALTQKLSGILLK